MSISVDRDQAFLTGIRRIAEEFAGPNAVDLYYGMADARIGAARLWLREPVSVGAADEAA